jgi:transposase
MTLYDLEFSLPLRIQCSEKKEMPCPNCNRDVQITVTYEQRIWRSDDHFNGRKTRMYQISYAAENYSCVSNKYLLETERHCSFREALINAHKLIDRLGLKP